MTVFRTLKPVANQVISPSSTCRPASGYFTTIKVNGHTYACSVTSPPTMALSKMPVPVADSKLSV